MKHTLLTALLLVVACVPVAGRTQTAPLDGLDQQLEQVLKDWRTPGLTLAVVKNDKVLLTRGFGVRKVGERTRVDERTMFANGSTSKAFAAATVALLVADGLLQWDDRVEPYLPWLEVYDEWVTRALTVRDLLTHRVGTSHAVENNFRPYSVSARDILERSRGLSPVAPFRSEFVYSNNMFIASGQLVATITGKTWEDFARERLWIPLGMLSTGANSVVIREGPNAATPHEAPIGSDPVPQEYQLKDQVVTPSGGVNSNARDMAQWLRFQLAAGAIDGRRLIPQPVFLEMHTPQTVIRHPEKDIAQFPPTAQARGHMRFFSYGMGWYVMEYRGRKMVWHSGTSPGFRTGVALLPDEGLGVYVAVNRIPSTLPFAVMLIVFDRLLGVPAEDWSKLFLEHASAAPPAGGESNAPVPAR